MTKIKLELSEAQYYLMMETLRNMQVTHMKQGYEFESAIIDRLHYEIKTQKEESAKQQMEKMIAITI